MAAPHLRLVLVLASAASAAAAAAVFGASPSSGSLAGGSTLLIYGAGFSSPMDGGTTPRVWLGTDECKVEPYYSSDTQLSCTTPPAPLNAAGFFTPTTVPIQVSLGQLNTRSAYLASPALTWTFSATLTPVLSLTSGGGAAGKQLAAWGSLRSPAYDDYSASVAGAACGGGEAFYSNPTSIASSSGWVGFRCVLSDMPPGRYNVSLGAAAGGYGSAWRGRRSLQWTADGAGSLFQFTSHPRITSLSLSSSGQGGGGTLLITGTGFSPAAAGNTVLLGGGAGGAALGSLAPGQAECAVTAATANSIACTLPPAPAAAAGAAGTPSAGGAPRPAGRGLLHEVWLAAAGALSAPPMTGPAAITTTATGVLSGYFNEEGTQYYSQRLTGFFVPPVSAFYSFAIDSDDGATLSLSTSAAAAGAVAIASVPSYSGSFFAFSQQISAPIWLNASTPYWTRVVHTQGSGGDHLHVAMRIHAGLMPNASARGAPMTAPNAAVAALQSSTQLAFASVPTVQRVALTVSVVRATQTLTVAGAAPGGTLLVYWQGMSATAPAAINTTASAAEVRAALATLGFPCSSLSVTRAARNSAATGAPGLAWTVTIGCASSAPWPAFALYSGGALPLPPWETVELGASSADGSLPLAGSFTLGWGGAETAPLSAQASGSAVQAALQALPGFGEVAVLSSSASGDGASWLLSFAGPYGDMAPLNISAALTGTAAAATVTIMQAGSADPYYWPVPLDHFRTPLAAEPVTVISNGILSDCDVFAYNATNGSTACAFAYAGADATPQLLAISPSAGGLTAGATLSISGSGFVALAAPGVPPLVLLNSTPACSTTVVVSDTQLTCTLGPAAAGAYVVSVLVGAAAGLAVPVNGSAPLRLEYVQAVTGLAPASGSAAGGTILTISGSGFSGAAAADVVLVNGSRCLPVPGAASFSNLTCITPATTMAPLAAAAGVAVPVLVNGAPAGSFTFVAPPLLTSLAPARLPAGISGVLTLALTGVPAGAAVSVAVGARRCAVLSTSWGAAGAATLNCTLVRGAPRALPQAPIAPTITVAGVGFADAAAARLDDSFRVSSVSPAEGSLAGGTVVTLTGTGFNAAALASNEVAFVWNDGSYGNTFTAPCPVTAVAADGSSVTCTVPPVPPAQRGDPLLWNASTTPLLATLVAKVNNVTAPCAPPNCNFAQVARLTPVITDFALVPDARAPSGRVLIVNGSALNTTGLTLAVGGLPCAATPAPATARALSCFLPIGPAGAALITAYSRAAGDIAFGGALAADGSTASVDLPLWVAPPPASPAVGSAAGGLLLALTGAGFPLALSDAVVLFGAVRGTVVQGNASHMLVQAPPAPSGAALPLLVNVTVSNSAAGQWPAIVLPSAMRYDAARTPRLLSVSPTAGTAGATLTLRGVNFTSSARVFIGGVECAPLAGGNASLLQCSLGASPAGAHRVLVYDAAIGVATAAPALLFAVPATVSAVSASTLGYGGGQNITLTGAGFAAAGLGANMVQLCNTLCAVQSASASSLTCTTAPLVTRAALGAFPVYDAATILAPSPGALSPPAAAAAMDGSVISTFSSCSVTLDLGAATRAIITGVSAYPAFRKTAAMAGASFAGSVDGASYTPIAQLSSFIFEGWNNVQVLTIAGVTSLLPTVSANASALSTGIPVGGAGGGAPAVVQPADIGAQPAYRFLRFAFAPQVALGGAASCPGSEVRFTGFVLGATSGGSDTCAVNVTVAADASASSTLATAALAGTPASVAAAVTLPPLAFSAPLTPLVTAISPNNGSALGGTLLTLSGLNFPTSPADVTVLLNGMPCAVQSAAASAITCITGARVGAPQPVSVAVSVAGAGLALYDASTVYFRYLDRWSALTTWKYQEPPVAGDTVIVPPGQAILVDVSPPELFLVFVEGELVFDNQDLTFDASYIIGVGGSISAGSEAQPFVNKLTITLHGDRDTQIEVPGMGAKCLVVMPAGTPMSDKCGLCGIPSWYAANQPARRAYASASLDLHGRPRQRVWTMLRQDAPVGTSTLYLTEPVDWEAGESLFVTDNADPLTNTEVVVVAGRDAGDARTVYLTAPLLNPHRSRIVPTAGWRGGLRDLDERAEVGLLTRNIVVQGDDSSPAQLYGSHMAAMMGGRLRLENIEIRRCGQAGKLGRYCSHFHMMGDASGSYIRHNSVHDSFQRAVTVHASNYASVVGNAAYNVLGHTIFLEDGVEQWNTIEGNLVAVTRKCFICGPSDNKASNFWTASPTNIFRSNRGAGAVFGFWFELPSRPHGRSYTPYYCPANMPLVEHFNNTFHGSGIGMRIYPQWHPLTAPCGDESDPALAQPQYLRNLTSTFNGLGMFHKHVGSLHHISPTFADNGVGFSWLHLEGVPLTRGDPNVVGALFVCSVDEPSACGARGMIAPQDEYWYAAGMTFVNFGSRGSPLSGCNGCEDGESYSQGAFTYNVSGLAFVNSPVRVTWNSPPKDIFIDNDGSLTGLVGGWAVAPFGFNAWPACPFDTSGALSGGNRCNSSVIVRRLQVDWVAPTALEWQTLNVSSAAGWGRVPFRPRVQYGWVWPVVTQQWYAHGWEAPRADSPQPDFTRHRTSWSDAPHLEEGPLSDWVGMSWSYVMDRYANAVTYGGYPQSNGALRGGTPVLPLPAGVAPTPASAMGQGAFPLNNSWSVILSRVNATAADPSVRYSFSTFNKQCAPGGCNPPPTMNIGSAMLWSAPSSWPTGAVPVAGQDVKINSTSYIIMDVNPPPLGSLTIEGKLAFLDTDARSLRANNIVVWGELSVGTAAAPFQNSAEIVLAGAFVAGAPQLKISDNLFLNNKVLAVLGRLSLVGAPRAPVWTRLAATAEAGASTIVLAQPVAGAWQPGDVLALSATGYDWTAYETATVASVAGAAVTLTAPLAYTHFAGAAAPSGLGAAVPLRGAVALLTRNVVLRGAMSSPSDTYGATVFVGRLAPAVQNTGGLPGSPGGDFVGSVDLRYVQFNATGKMGLQTPSLQMQYGEYLFNVAPATTAPRNYLEGVAFTGGFGPAIDAISAPNLVVNASVVHRSFGPALSLNAYSQNATIVGNAVLGVELPPNVNAAGQTLWHRPQVAVLVNTWAAALSGNLVAGANDVAFSYRVPACSAPAARYAGNEAHGVRIGALLLPTRTAGACVRLDGFTVWHAAHVGVLTVDQLSTVRIDRLLASDCHIGVSLSYLNSVGVDYATPSAGTLTNSVILGSTAASPSCARDSTCRAVGPDDLRGERCSSVLGSGYRRAGLLLPQYLSFAKTCDQNGEMSVCSAPHSTATRLCSLPLESRTGVIGKANVELRLTNVTFGYFSGASDCGARSTAIVQSPAQVDMSTPIFAAGISWVATPLEARFAFSSTDGVCSGGLTCDAINFALALDQDGSLLGGAPNATAMGPNPLAAAGSPACSSVSAWNGIACSGATTYRKAVIEGLEVGRISMGMMMHTQWIEPANNASWRTSQSFGSFKEPCSKHQPQPIFSFFVTPGATSSVVFPSTEPGQLMLSYINSAASEAPSLVVLALKLSYQWQIFVDGKAAPDLSALAGGPRRPARGDAPGAYLNSPQTRQLFFLLVPGVRSYNLVRQPTLGLNFRLAITLEQFDGPAMLTALQILLGIPAWRIKIVDVQPGSTIVSLQISDSEETVYANSPANASDPALAAAAAAQVARLSALAASVQALAASGALASVAGYPVSGLTLVPPASALVNESSPLISGVATSGGIVINTAPASGAGGLSAGAIAGIVIGAVAGIALIAAGAVLLQRRRRVHAAREKLTRPAPEAADAAAADSAAAAVAGAAGTGRVLLSHNVSVSFDVPNDLANDSYLRRHGVGANVPGGGSARRVFGPGGSVAAEAPAGAAAAAAAAAAASSLPQAAADAPAHHEAGARARRSSVEPMNPPAPKA